MSRVTLKADRAKSVPGAIRLVVHTFQRAFISNDRKTIRPNIQRRPTGNFRIRQGQVDHRISDCINRIVVRGDPAIINDNRSLISNIETSGIRSVRGADDGQILERNSIFRFAPYVERTSIFYILFRGRNAMAVSIQRKRNTINETTKEPSGSVVLHDAANGGSVTIYINDCDQTPWSSGVDYVVDFTYRGENHTFDLDISDTYSDGYKFYIS